MSSVLQWISDVLMSGLNFIMPVLDFIGPTMTSPAVTAIMTTIFWCAVSCLVLYYHVDRRLHALIALAFVGYFYTADKFAMPACHWLEGIFPRLHWMAVDAVYVILVMIFGYLALCLSDRLQGPKWRLADGINIFRRRHWHYASPNVDEEVLNNIDCPI